MSASDAAPLPRLGEVFFDVRGSSRSMRLSWYADTGVAVFSIWQGGMCTGTFRLPIGDLPRMVEILQRGPQGAGHPAAEHGSGYDPGRSQDYPTGSMLGPEAMREHPPMARQPGYGPDELVDARQAAYRRDEFVDSRGHGYGQDSFDVFEDTHHPSYQSQQAGQAGYPGHSRDESAQTMAADYDQGRFVPPYVRGPEDEYGNDIPASGMERATSPGRDAYRGQVPPSRSDFDEYEPPEWAPADYSDERRYR